MGNAEDRVGRVVREAIGARARREPDLQRLTTRIHRGRGRSTVNTWEEPAVASTSICSKLRERLPSSGLLTWHGMEENGFIGHTALHAWKWRQRACINKDNFPSKVAGQNIHRGAGLWVLYLRVCLEHSPVQIVGDLPAVLHLRHHVLESWPTGRRGRDVRGSLQTGA